MNKFLTILSLSALLVAPAFAKGKVTKGAAPIAGDAAAKPAEGTAPAADKKDEGKPAKKGKGKAKAKGEIKAEAKPEAKAAEAAPAK